MLPCGGGRSASGDDPEASPLFAGGNKNSRTDGKDGDGWDTVVMIHDLTLPSYNTRTRKMSSQDRMSPSPVIMAVLAGLVVGVPAGAIGSAIVRGSGQVEPPVSHSSHAGGGHGAGAATKAFQEASARMHANMGGSYTGDTDVDFARGMLPHHQGAVDMARVEIEHGRDPDMRRLARKVIDTQEIEMSQMRDWMTRRSGARP